MITYEVMDAYARQRGWQLMRNGKGKFALVRDIQTPEYWCGTRCTIIPVKLRSVVATLNDIEHNPDRYRDITHPVPPTSKGEV
jgi:hypothetical protein